ncbi:MAG: hypothetical protein JXA92_12495 [candidate division Zixibacteria bacterium]|nr:hypothetical protein [candidate division Zixibacteria bacterium]
MKKSVKSTLMVLMSVTVIIFSGCSRTESPLGPVSNEDPNSAEPQDVTVVIDFEDPDLGRDAKRVFSTYVDEASGVYFTAHPDGEIGLVKNCHTQVPVEGDCDNQKLGTGCLNKDLDIGYWNGYINAAFPYVLKGNVTVSIEVQMKPNAEIILFLIGNDNETYDWIIKRNTGSSNDSGATDNSQCSSTVIELSSDISVAQVRLISGSVFVIDNFRFTYSELGEEIVPVKGRPNFSDI